MEEELLKKLDELIIEGEGFESQIVYCPPPSDTYRTFNLYYVTNVQLFQTWVSTSVSFVKRYFPENFEELEFSASSVKNDYNKLLAILKAIKNLSTLPKLTKNISSKEVRSGLKIEVNNINTNTQSQELIVSIFNEAIKDELKGKELKEIKEILEEYKEKPEEAKVKVLERLKSFGSDVLSNILANIITNPTVWGGF